MFEAVITTWAIYRGFFRPVDMRHGNGAVRVVALIERTAAAYGLADALTPTHRVVGDVGARGDRARCRGEAGRTVGV